MNTSLGGAVSVCLVTYNHVDVVESTLRSILDQTIRGYEVIVSDDCSTDGTWERILVLAAMDERIKPVRTPRNLGMAGNANFAVAQSERPYVALLHHDDLYRQDMLEKWSEVLEHYPDAAFVFNPYRDFERDAICGEPMPGACVSGAWLLKRYLLARWGCVVRGTAMIRRESWVQVGGMRERFGLLADVDMWMRLAMRWPVGYVSEPLITVRHLRPGYYPAIYKEGSWSWRRQTLLYEIHAANRLDLSNVDTFPWRLQWWKFRVRVTAESMKWLIYAVVRGKYEIISSSHESATSYDLWPLPLFRRMLQRTFISAKT